LLLVEDDWAEDHHDVEAARPDAGDSLGGGVQQSDGMTPAWRSGREGFGMRGRVWVRGRTLLALMALLLPAACAASPEAGKAATVTTPPSKSVDDSAPARPQPAGGRRATGLPRVERFCRSRFPDAYATRAVTEDQEGLIVYRRPVSGFDAAVQRSSRA
jgi:hypothetical protein